MATNNNTTLDIIRDLSTRIRYEKETGLLYWNDDTKNKRRGMLVGGSTNGKGYRKVKYRKAQLSQHRVIFFIHHGYMPELIDHIDCDRSNNRLENLRACTSAQNNQNARLAVTNTSGHKGVHFNKDDNAWAAEVKHNGKRIRFRYFKNKDDAINAVREARERLHGEFARHS